MTRPMIATLATVPLLLLASTGAAEDATDAALEIRGLDEVYFEFESSAVSGQHEPIAEIAAYAEDHPTATIVLDAHTDPVGTPAYNVGLSIRRAEAVKSQLIEQGVDKDRIVLAFYGEDGLRRSRHALERRVTAWATQDPLYLIVRHELRRAVAMTWDEPVTAVAIDGPRVEEVATR